MTSVSWLDLLIAHTGWWAKWLWCTGNIPGQAFQHTVQFKIQYIPLVHAWLFAKNETFKLILKWGMLQCPWFKTLLHQNCIHTKVLVSRELNAGSFHNKAIILWSYLTPGKLPMSIVESSDYSCDPSCTPHTTLSIIHYDIWYSGENRMISDSDMVMFLTWRSVIHCKWGKWTF